MKSAKELWDELSKRPGTLWEDIPSPTKRDFLRSELSHVLREYHEETMLLIELVQADTIEAAALRCAGIAYLHHHEHNECEGRDAANECVAEVRKLKPEQTETSQGCADVPNHSSEDK